VLALEHDIERVIDVCFDNDMALFCQFSFYPPQFFIKPSSLAQQLFSPLLQALVPLPRSATPPCDQLGPPQLGPHQAFFLW
jgi:hypothetical protein